LATYPGAVASAGECVRSCPAYSQSSGAPPAAWAPNSYSKRITGMEVKAPPAQSAAPGRTNPPCLPRTPRPPPTVHPRRRVCRAPGHDQPEWPLPSLETPSLPCLAGGLVRDARGMRLWLPPRLFRKHGAERNFEVPGRVAEDAVRCLAGAFLGVNPGPLTFRVD